MRPILKLIPDDTNINFIKFRLLAFVISAFMLIGSMFYTFQHGLNFGIDFTGGTLVEIKTKAEKADIVGMRKKLGELNIGEVSIQEFGSPSDVLIRIPQQDRDEKQQKAVMDKVRTSLGDEVEYRRVEFVGPQVGSELIEAGTKALIYSLLGILIYIWARFEWQFAVAAVVALAHDTLLTVGFFAITQMEFNLSTVAAVLMIAGYSINDTVVVFDRVRENMRKFKKKPFEELSNISINQTLSRTLMTSLTTLLALVALWLFGGEVIKGFIEALIFGVLIGTYSSIFVATPLLLYFIPRKNIVASATPHMS